MEIVCERGDTYYVLRRWIGRFRNRRAISHNNALSEM